MKILKLSIVIYIVVLQINKCIAQTFVLKNDTLIESIENINRKNKTTLNENNILKKGYLFNKIKETKDSVYFYCLPDKNNSEFNKIFYNDNVNAKKPNKIFVFSKEDALRKFQKKESKFGFGTVILPLKLRFGGGDGNERRYFDFESGLNIGLSLTYKFNSEFAKIEKYFIFNLATSSIKINSNNTNNFIEKETNASALSPSIGFVFEFENEIQFIITSGIDYLTGEVSKKWIYRDKPFLGLGIGFSIFKFGEKNSNTQP